MARKAVKREPPSSSTLDEAIFKTPASDPTLPNGSDHQDNTTDSDVVMLDSMLEKINDSSLLSGSAKVPERSPDTLSSQSQKGLEILGRGVKELVQAIQQLRHIGIEDLVLPLPKIVVVGDQSTGKSSLIEGMSGIKVPRDVGTCTRCPLEINLSESQSTDEEWTCNISLYKKYIYDGGRKDVTKAGKHSFTRSEGATRARPLGPWMAQDGEIFQFATLTSKDQVAQTLKLAQLAILNPGTPHQNYMPGQIDPGEEKQVQFSPNVVRLEISGQNLPNLSFYDLPGVINVSETEEEEYLVTLVKNLVKEYIKAENCINILAIPMTDDPANSTAFDLIRKFKAEDRTVGVLTKPDRIQLGESCKQWTEILEGQKFKLGFGYFIVKNNPDTRVDHYTARVEEQDFFSKTPWDTELKEYQHRFGTLKLQTSLSHELTTQIKANVPHIINQVAQKAANIDAELSKIPESPAGNVLIKILEKIVEFEKEIHLQIDGGSESHTFFKCWKNEATKFRKVLVECRPICRFVDQSNRSFRETSNVEEPWGTPTPSGRQVPQQIISIDDDDIEPEISGGKRRLGTGAEMSPCKRNPTEVQFSGRLIDIPYYGVPRTSSRACAKRFELKEIRDIIQDAYIGLPGGYPPKARERMIRLSLASWEEPTREFLDLTDNLCRHMLREQIGKTFGQWESTPLYARIANICDCFLEEVLSHQRKAADQARSLELQTITTFNDEILKTHCDKAQAIIGDARRRRRAIEYIEQESKISKSGGRATKEDKILKITDQQLGRDPFSDEVQLMSSVRGYYEYALSRFVDSIGHGIQGELFFKCRNDLGLKLRHEIGLEEADANERCAAMLEVDNENRERRVQLKKEKNTINEAQRWLEKLTSETAGVLF